MRKRKLKKFIALILAFLMLFSLGGECGFGKCV